MKLCLKSVLCFSLMLIMSGCDDLSRKRNQAQETRKPESSVPVMQNGRFVPITPYNEGRMPVVGIPWHGFFALDTKTGALCRTLDKEFTQSEWANTLPLCMELLGDKSKANDPAGILGSTNPEAEKELDKYFGKPK
jgi:hypothetical protein